MTLLNTFLGRTKLAFVVLALAVAQPAIAQKTKKSTTQTKKTTKKATKSTKNTTTAASPKKAVAKVDLTKLKYRTSPNGTRYFIVPNSKNDKATKASLECGVIGHLSYGDKNGKLIFSSRDNGEPVQFTLQPTANPNDPMEVFTLLKEGDSVIIEADPKALFGEKPVPGIEAGDNIYLFFSLSKVLSKAEVAAIAAEEAKAKSPKVDPMQKSKDAALIADYVAANKLTPIVTPSGLNVVITKTGDGQKPPVGSKVVVHYTGMLLNGKKFDSSVDRGDPFSFTLGVGQVIGGWDEGIGMLDRGAKGLLIIPSDQGYGARGAGGSIPPNSVLIFEVELIDF